MGNDSNIFILVNFVRFLDINWEFFTQRFGSFSSDMN